MQFLELSLPTAAENLALDDALLQSLEETEIDVSTDNACPEAEAERSLLRIWQVDRPCAIVGRSSRVRQEVHWDRVQRDNIPVLRRSSGGASVVIAPGCLLYSLLIDLAAQPNLRPLDAAHRYVTQRMLEAIQPLHPAATRNGTCDLTSGGRKFSGNSLRVGRRGLLYHGTLLLDMDLSLIDRYLQHPPKEPSYREGRSHADFLTNLHVDGDRVVARLREAWQADRPCSAPPLGMVPRWLQTRYQQESWNLQR